MVLPLLSPVEFFVIVLSFGPSVSSLGTSSSAVPLALARGSGELQYTESWGYTEVRPGAHSFWWLYESTAHATTRPLVMWLQVSYTTLHSNNFLSSFRRNHFIHDSQGGPGASGTGHGNFKEIGPLFLDGDNTLSNRSFTWVRRATTPVDSIAPRTVLNFSCTRRTYSSLTVPSARASAM